jgi:tRNA modification GTPase
MSPSPAPDTIFAVSSGRPPAAIAVVRISGPQAGDALRLMIGRIPEPRRAALARVRDPQSQEMIDEALALWFPGPKSETGEDMAELQLHGGRAVIAATFAALGRIDGVRPAEPGEFTRRAFANGHLDLTEVEGLADLIAAETEAQRRQAFGQMKGALGRAAEAWRQRLIETLALTEAGIDFADEDVPADLMPEVRARTQALADEIGRVLDDGHRGERLRDGLVVAIAGPPNAGKSTLLNRIARRDAAIVSPTPGTTRDVIEVHLDLGGYPVTLLDTAGIRDTTDPIELEGVNRARARAAAADLVLWVIDATDLAASSPQGGHRTSEAGPPFWLVRNKIDLIAAESAEGGSRIPRQPPSHSEGPVAPSALQPVARSAVPPSPPPPQLTQVSNESRNSTYRNEQIIEKYDIILDISARDDVHVDSFLDEMTRFLAGHGPTEPALITRARHRQALGEAREALGRALQAQGDDLVAEELRLAARALGRLTGRIDVEDILDVIFRDFCIGK